MGNAGARHFVVKDSSLSTEIFVSGSSRTEEWDMINSTISGANRVKRSHGFGTLTLPLGENVTIIDNNLFHDPGFVDVLSTLVMLNIFFGTIIFIQMCEY